MSLIVTRPPRPPVVKTATGSRRVYTLHSNPNNVFAWRLRDERLKTATIAFRRQEDAILMATMIERHVVNTKQWPDVQLVESTFKLFSGLPGNFGNIVYLQSWQMDNLKAFCAQSYLDMLVLRSVRKVDDTYKINGDVVFLTMPDDYYIHRLEEIYDSTSHDEE